MTTTNQTKLRRSGIYEYAAPMGLNFILACGFTNISRLAALGLVGREIQFAADAVWPHTDRGMKRNYSRIKTQLLRKSLSE